jgi:hypothetical protein
MCNMGFGENLHSLCFELSEKLGITLIQFPHYPSYGGIELPCVVVSTGMVIRIARVANALEV